MKLHLPCWAALVVALLAGCNSGVSVHWPSQKVRLCDIRMLCSEGCTRADVIRALGATPFSSGDVVGTDDDHILMFDRWTYEIRLNAEDRGLLKGSAKLPESALYSLSFVFYGDKLCEAWIFIPRTLEGVEERLVGDEGTNPDAQFSLMLPVQNGIPRANKPLQGAPTKASSSSTAPGGRRF